MRILVVEDDRKVASFIQSGLQQEGHAVDVLHDGTDAGAAGLRDRLRRGGARPDAARPIGFPGTARHPRPQGRAAGDDPHGEGLDRRTGDRARRRRATTTWESRSPSPSSRRGFVRCSAAAGRTRATLHVADLEMDTIRRTVRRAGQAIDLKPKEYALLEFLMRHSDRPVTRSLIIEHVWDIHFDSISNVVEVHINSLRTKIDRGFAGAPHSHRARRGLHARRAIRPAGHE